MSLKCIALKSKKSKKYLVKSKSMHVKLTKPTSSFLYFRQDVKAFRESENFETFMADPEKYSQLHYSEARYHWKGDIWWLAKDNMAWDLGYSDEQDKIETFVEEVANTYDFVLIMEYLDYGLLVLKEMLGLTYDDIMYVVVNAQSKLLKANGLARDSKTPEEIKREKLNKHLAKKAYHWAKLDTALYTHFNTTFWQKVEEYGITEEMVEKFRNLSKRKSDICIAGRTTQMNTIPREYRPWVPAGMTKISSYVLSDYGQQNELCKSLIRPELGFSQRLRTKQGWPMSPKFLVDHYNKETWPVERLEEFLNLKNHNLTVW